MAKTTLAADLTLTLRDGDGAGSKNCDFTMSAELLRKETDRAAGAFSAQAPIPGFRKGKAPAAMVVKRYENELKEELQRRVMGAAFERLGDIEKLDVVYCRMPEKAELELGKEFKFTLLIDLAPEIPAVEYKGVAVSAPAAQVDEKEVDERIAQYRKMYAEFEEITTPAAAEDMLKVDYTSDFELAADADKSLARQVKAEGNYLWLAEPEYIPGCTKALVGAVKDGEYKFAATYPADFREAALAGKTVHYTVKVVAVQRRKELDDAALAAKMQLKEVSQLRDMLKQGMMRDAEGKRQGEVREAVYAKIDALVGDFALPAGLLEAEAAQTLQRMAQSHVKSAEEAEAFKKDIETKRAEAKVEAARKLRRDLIFRKFAKLENITVTAAEVDHEIANLSRYYGRKPNELRATLEQNGAIEELQAEILSNKVWDFLAANAKVETK